MNIQFMIVEFLDELVQGLRDPAWPAIRLELALSYSQIGLILWLPRLFSSITEPLLFVLADSGYRRRIVFLGASFFALSLTALGLVQSFLPFLLAMLIFYPASGAFVSLTQASLMDLYPERRERNMALWTAFGSGGNLAGPIVITLLFALGLSWRPAFIATGLITLPVWAFSRKLIIENGKQEEKDIQMNLLTDLRGGLKGAIAALKRRGLLLNLITLEAADSMGDIFAGFLTLFLVGGAGHTLVEASFLMVVWTSSMVAGNLLLLPLLKKLDGMRMVRARGFILLIGYPSFLLAQSYAARILLLILIGLSAAGWYPVLSARLFSILPQKSGTIQAVSSLSGAVTGVIPFLLGIIADRYGITLTMWILSAGIILVILIPELPGFSSDS